MGIKVEPAITGGSGGGIPEAPIDGSIYGRKDASWATIVSSARTIINTAVTKYVNTDAASNGDGSISTPFNSFENMSVWAKNLEITVDGQVIISVTGTATLDITKVSQRNLTDMVVYDPGHNTTAVTQKFIIKGELASFESCIISSAPIDATYKRKYKLVLSSGTFNTADFYYRGKYLVNGTAIDPIGGSGFDGVDNWIMVSNNGEAIANGSTIVYLKTNYIWRDNSSLNSTTTPVLSFGANNKYICLQYLNLLSSVSTQGINISPDEIYAPKFSQCNFTLTTNTWEYAGRANYNSIISCFFDCVINVNSMSQRALSATSINRSVLLKVNMQSQTELFFQNNIFSVTSLAPTDCMGLMGKATVTGNNTVILGKNANSFVKVANNANNATLQLVVSQLEIYALSTYKFTYFSSIDPVASTSLSSQPYLIYIKSAIVGVSNITTMQFATDQRNISGQERGSYFYYNGTELNYGRSNPVNALNPTEVIAKFGSTTPFIFVESTGLVYKYSATDGRGVDNINYLDTKDSGPSRYVNVLYDMSVNTIKFNSNITTPAFTEGQVFYDKTWKTLAAQIDDDVTVQIGQESLQYVYNNSGVDISDGQPVYKTGVAGTAPVTITVALAKADREATSNVIGVATTGIANGTYGMITCRGYINNFNTTTFGTVGNDLWLSPTTAGALTTTRPTSPNVQVKIGTLIVSHATLGRIHVTPVSWGELFSMSELKATQFPGICAETPITNANISIDYSTLVLTITPPLGYMHYFTDGNGVITKHEVIGSIAFPAFTNTSGSWFFYFNHSGVAVTTQTPWTASDFPSVAPVYRLLWNATLTGSARSVAEYIEYHLNDIPADTHQWFHLSGAIWGGGIDNGDIKSNALTSGTPNADGRNTVVAMTTVKNIDDNLEYTVTNSTGGLAWQQDLGNIVPASLNATNSALFQTFYQDAGGLITFTPATRFPFPWSAATNRPQYFTPAGAIVEVSGSNFMTVFIYATQNPRTGEALKIVTATTDFTSITNARAFNWVDIQNSYSVIGIDNEIRPMYRLIFEFRTGSYNVGCKYSVLREVQDLRKTIVTSTATASGSIPASSVTFIPAGNISSTNVQSALEELDLEKASINNSIAYAIALG